MTPPTTSTCPNCRGSVLPGDRFCGSCGTPVADTAPTADGWATPTGPLTPSAETTDVKPVGNNSPWAAVAARLQAATLGEFEILTELGRGGMAAVYLARDLALNRRVAIKVMSPGLLLGAGMIERFRQEAVTVANLQHAHIVSIYSVRLLEDLHFFVMQFVPGKTLEGVLRGGDALPVPVVRAWLYQIGSALGYAHRRGVIHRDIKPGNILLSADGEAIVTDFGIAKVAESPSHTKTGTVVGTPVYMSPEQCFARELTGASDQYSLGVVAYEMLAGRPPFSGSSFALMRAHTDDPPAPLRDTRLDVPPAMEAAVLRMLAKKPEERYATLAEALVSAGASPIGPDDPLHATLQELAAATERLQQLGDVLRTPASPVPQTRERVKPPAAAPPAPALVIVIAPPPADLEPGATAVLRATMRNATDHTVAGHELAWTSSAPNVVTVDAKLGRLTAIAPGHATITATAGTAHDSVDVTIDEPRPANIAVSVPNRTALSGEQLVALAVVTSRHGVRVSRAIEWSVDDPAVAKIERRVKADDSGSVNVRALSAGTTDVIASCGGAVGRASLHVMPITVVSPQLPDPRPPVASPPPASPPLASPPRAAAPRHEVPPITPPLSAPPPAARSLNATAVLSPTSPAPAPAPAAPAPGVPSSSATRESSAAAASPTPVPPIPTTATPSSSGGLLRWALPAAAVVGIVGFVALRGLSSEDQGPVVPPADSVQSPTTPVVARPDTTVQRADSLPVVVRPTDTTSVARPDSTPSPPPRAVAVASRIDLRPARPASVAPGETVALTATVRDSSGAAMNRARVTWTSTNPRVASVDANRGLVRAVGAGTARIAARSGAASATVAVTVTPPAPDPTLVATIDVADVRALTVGESARLTASVRNATGGVVPGADVEWTSSNAAVATVGQDGTLTARGAGLATIRASAGGRSTEQTVTVRAREVVTRPDTPAVSRNTPAPKSEAELRAEIQGVIGTYARAIETRDTSLIRRVFPNAPGELVARWQTTFDDARGNIQMRNAAIDVLDAPRDVAGAQVRARVRYAARFSSRTNRSDQSFPVAFDAVLQRDSGTWRITSIR